MRLLLVFYSLLVLDLVLGLPVNVFGWGREPLWFSLATVAVAAYLYARGRYALGMIGLVACCAWLLFYPADNAWDVVLVPTMAVGAVAWFLQRRRNKSHR